METYIDLEHHVPVRDLRNTFPWGTSGRPVVVGYCTSDPEEDRRSSYEAQQLAIRRTCDSRLGRENYHIVWICTPSGQTLSGTVVHRGFSMVLALLRNWVPKYIAVERIERLSTDPVFPKWIKDILRSRNGQLIVAYRSASSGVPATAARKRSARMTARDFMIVNAVAWSNGSLDPDICRDYNLAPEELIEVMRDGGYIWDGSQWASQRPIWNENEVDDADYNPFAE